MIEHPVLPDEDRPPPKAVADAAERGLELRREHKRGGAEVGARRAAQLMSQEILSDRDIRSMYSYFARHVVDKHGRDWNNKDKPSAGYIAWRLWGGDAARDWIHGLRETLPEVGV